MAEIKVVNIVGTALLGKTFDLDSMTLALDGAEYEPEQFPGMVYHTEEPKAAFLIFKSGKVVCTGTRSPEMAQDAVKKVVKTLNEIGVDTYENPQIEIVNIVASSDLHAELNLNQVAVGLGLENIEYEPEQFPGMVYRVYNPKVVLLLFCSGRIICTGARVISDAEKAVDGLRKDLEDLGFL